MRKLLAALVVASTALASGCQTFPKEHDLELYIVGAGLVYLGAKHLCRNSEFEETCAIGAATTFVLWY